VLLLPQGLVGEGIGKEPPQLGMEVTGCTDDMRVRRIILEVVRRILDVLWLTLCAMAVDVLPGLGIDEGQLIWCNTDDGAILEVKLVEGESMSTLCRVI
jgi:hypothetical protein